jgi:hypothetical protein
MLNKKLDFQIIHREASGAREVSASIKDMVESLGDDSIPCLICMTRTINRGLFMPEDVENYGGEKGEIRVACFPLCKECHDEEDANGCRRIRGILLQGSNNEEVIH